MTFEKILDEALAMLQRRRRVTYCAIQRQFNLDDIALKDLKQDLVYEYPKKIKECGDGLLWLGETPPSPLPVDRHTLDNAEKLLKHAVDVGIQVDLEVVQEIIKARHPGNGVVNNESIARLIKATTTLANAIKPVTIESLCDCESDAKKTIKRYERYVGILAVVLIPLAIASFIMAGISNTITAQIKLANELTVELHTQINTSATSDSNQSAPTGTLSDLQQLAVAMRTIYSRTQQLNWFVLRMESDRVPGENPEKKREALELPSNLKNSVEELRKEIETKTKTYQDVRLYATSVQDTVSVVWGAISTCLLPVLYACLGACADLVLTFSEQLRTRTFTPSYTPSARFVIAAIAGMVVGLFNNFTLGQDASISPLAIAFLAGYASDRFFSFLAQNLPKTKSS